MEDSPDAFGRNDLPIEIQYLIFRACLRGWKIKVATYEDVDRNETTTRVYSTCFDNKLTFSLTCKKFHQLIQEIQYDLDLFSGELDHIDGNGDMRYILDGQGAYAYWFTEATPYLLYQTRRFRLQVFIAAMLDEEKNNEKLRSRQKRKHVMSWITTNVRSMDLYLDELRVPRPPTTWGSFVRLKHLNIFWPLVQVPYTRDEFEGGLCNLSSARLLQLAEDATSCGFGYFYPGDYLRTAFSSLLNHKSLRVTWQLPDSHSRIQQLNEASALQRSSNIIKTKSLLSIVCSVDYEGWSFLSSSCVEEGSADYYDCRRVISEPRLLSSSSDIFQRGFKLLVEANRRLAYID